MKVGFHVTSIKKIVGFLLNILIPLAVGALASIITSDNFDIYNAFVKPPLAPPAITFPIVWTLLYIIMGIANFLVTCEGTDKPEVRDATNFYYIQLTLNFLWPIVFFSYRMPFMASIILIILWMFIGITTAKFYRIKHAAGLLMLPYWLWVTFAGYLNIAIWLLNR